MGDAPYDRHYRGDTFVNRLGCDSALGEVYERAQNVPHVRPRRILSDELARPLYDGIGLVVADFSVGVGPLSGNGSVKQNVGVRRSSRVGEHRRDELSGSADRCCVEQMYDTWKEGFEKPSVPIHVFGTREQTLEVIAPRLRRPGFAWNGSDVFVVIRRCVLRGWILIDDRVQLPDKRYSVLIGERRGVLPNVEARFGRHLRHVALKQASYGFVPRGLDLSEQQVEAGAESSVNSSLRAQPDMRGSITIPVSWSR